MLSEVTGLPQSRVSNHLACLKDGGLVVNRQAWRHSYSRIADDKILLLLQVTDQVVADHAQRLAACVNYRVSSET